MHCVGCLLSHGRHIHPSVFIRNVQALGEEGYVTCSQPAPKEFALRFYDVTCIYYHEVWHVYNVNSLS